MDSIEERIKTSKTFSEIARLLGYEYYNGRIKKSIIEECKNVYGIDIVNVVTENRKKKCLYCGSLISCDKKFCNSSCAASYNNKNRIITDEHRQKTSESLKQYFAIHPRSYEKINGLYKNICKQCGAVFYRNRKFTYCSHSCANHSDDVKNKIRTKCNERINAGTFIGWRSRNITSYAEKFWKNVLDNHGIKYQREFYVDGYFLDFLIEINGYKIDLEIDGKQHKYEDRKNSDIKRDAVLKNLGYIVYRVEWNTVNTQNGKDLMRQKINRFVDFIKTYSNSNMDL